MKHFLLTIILSTICIGAMAQYRYRVEDCWEMAKNNYPSIKYFNLIEKSRDYSLLNASETKLPKKFDASTYDSPTSEDEKEALSLASRKNLSTYNALHSTSVLSDKQNPMQPSTPKDNLFVLSDRVNNLFYSLILLDKKLKINEMQQMQLIELTKIFTSSKDKKVNNSVNIKGLTVLVEKSKSDYDILKSMQKLYLDMLSQMIGRKVDEKTILIEPNTVQYLNRTIITTANFGLIDNNRYNPFTNTINLIPQHTNYSSSNYKIFDVAKKVKIENNQDNFNYRPSNLKETLFNINTTEQRENQRTEINTICRQIDSDLRMIDLQKEIIVISYNKIMRGISDIPNLTQSIINYVNLQNDLAAHNVQLMMSAGKFKLLYE
ncbi:MAG: hypothetical protein RR550_01650 [Rikenellaceae bacterium]